jgi:hypothetical protein
MRIALLDRVQDLRDIVGHCADWFAACFDSLFDYELDSPDFQQMSAIILEIASEIYHLQICQRPG